MRVAIQRIFPFDGVISWCNRIIDEWFVEICAVSFQRVCNKVKNDELQFRKSHYIVGLPEGEPTSKSCHINDHNYREL